MKTSDKFYNFVLYNWPIKRAVSWLLRSNFLTQNYFYQKKYQQLLKTKMVQHEKMPFRVMIENTNVCNSNCVFCPHSFMKREIGFMDLKLFKKIINQCVDLGIHYVTIYGFGEPLLDPLFIERVKYAKAQGIRRVTTNTNASLMNSEKAREIIDSGLDEIYISFDAATKETYRRIRPALDFARVENNILELVHLRRKLNKEKPEIILSFVEADQNRHEVKKYIRKWKKIADHISISLIHNWTGDLADKLNLKTQGFRRDPCRLLWTDMVISWNGEVPRCCNDYDNRVVLGNIRNLSISEIWGGEKLKTIRQQHQQRNFDNCADCTYNFHHKSPWWVSK